MERAATLKLSAAEYVAASATWDTRHEWVNGEAWAMSGGRPRHAAVIANAIAALAERLRGGPCRVASSDQRVHVRATRAWFYPDASVICGPWITDPDDPLSITNPSVLVEVLSPSTADFDRGAKFEHYRRLASLTDYVLVDPDARHVTHLRRTAEGWARVDLHEGALELAGPGVSLPVDALYADLEHVPA